MKNKNKKFRSPGNAYVEGDASSASYFLAGAAVTGGTITVEGCGTSSLQVFCLGLTVFHLKPCFLGILQFVSKFKIFSSGKLLLNFNLPLLLENIFTTYSKLYTEREREM